MRGTLGLERPRFLCRVKASGPGWPRPSQLHVWCVGSTWGNGGCRPDGWHPPFGFWRGILAFSGNMHVTRETHRRCRAIVMPEACLRHDAVPRPGDLIGRATCWGYMGFAGIKYLPHTLHCQSPALRPLGTFGGYSMIATGHIPTGSVHPPDLRIVIVAHHTTRPARHRAFLVLPPKQRAEAFGPCGRAAQAAQFAAISAGCAFRELPGFDGEGPELGIDHE